MNAELQELKAYLDEIASNIKALDLDAEDYHEKYQAGAKAYNSLNAIYRKKLANYRTDAKQAKAHEAYQHGLEYVREVGYLDIFQAREKAKIYNTKYEREKFINALVGQCYE
jgi:hypothetical protein